ncbi:MAG: FAD-dependent oxidoreductase [Eggerthellaceae bacterium]
MLKAELSALGSFLIEQAHRARVEAGGALAVDRDVFSAGVTRLVKDHPNIDYIVGEVKEPPSDADAVVLATGPLTSDALASWTPRETG